MSQAWDTTRPGYQTEFTNQGYSSLLTRNTFYNNAYSRSCSVVATMAFKEMVALIKTNLFL